MEAMASLLVLSVFFLRVSRRSDPKGASIGPGLGWPHLAAGAETPVWARPPGPGHLGARASEFSGWSPRLRGSSPRSSCVRTCFWAAGEVPNRDAQGAQAPRR